ncbi:MobF family relaxase [Nesterenkonia sp. K-15-9-6]|uniref:MobF family relaxase n=1 Tax=Nesterenkonia sp. K-15-9-6 TaxID=3093918 RepID=UPI0040444E07
MTVSISKMSIDYYLNSAAVGDGQGASRDMTSYYTETQAPPGRWHGSGLAGLGMATGATVTRRDAKRLYEDLTNPKTGQPLGRTMTAAKRAAPTDAKTPTGAAAKDTREKVAGFDLTFSAPKSVSVAWALAGPELQKRIQDAHHKAMEQTLAWTEAHVIQSRAGHAGVAHVPVTGLVASLFDHWDSRAGDPQLHTHAVISNRVQREADGQWVTIDSYTLHRHVVAISETYNSLLFDALHQDIGALPESRTTKDPALAAIRGELIASADRIEPSTKVELAGVPDELITEFSERSLAIEQATDELVQEHRTKTGRKPTAGQLLAIRQRATLMTRTPKTEDDATLAQKMIQWRRRTALTGQSPDAVVAAATGHPDQAITPDMLTPEIMHTFGRWALADTAQRRTTFTRANLIASAERVLRLVRCRDHHERHQLVSQVLDIAESQAVSLTETRSIAPDTTDPTISTRGRSAFDHRDVSGVFTTQQRLDDEAYLLSRQAQDTGPQLDPSTLATRLEEVRTSSGHQLSADQAQAAHRVLGSTSGLEAIIGPAGTGKTTTMAAIAELWTQDNGPGSVIGLAPSAVAAGVLSDEIGGAPTDNTAKWLYESVGRGAADRAGWVAHNEAKLAQIPTVNPTSAQAARAERLRASLAQDYATQARYTMRPGQLIIMDEASMISTDQMTEIARQADAAGAKVLLVGDPAQLDAVDAGGFLGLIDRTQEPARLDTIWRFSNAWESAASLQLREGREEAITTYCDNGRIHGDADTDPADTAYAAWLADRTAGKKSILIAADNQTVDDLDRRAQADLVAAGEVDVKRTVNLKNEQFAGTGDVILARRNNRRLRDSTGAFITNGTRLTITKIRRNGTAQAINEATEGTITLDADYLAKSVELGYATTAHRSQGVTVDTAHSVISQTLPRELFYVAMTRGKHANHAYVALPNPEEEVDNPDPWKMMSPTPGPKKPEDVITRILKTSSAERSAHEVRDAEFGWANDLGRMVHEHTYLAWAARTSRTQDWIRERYGEDALTSLQQDPDWSRLVSADPATNHTPPEPTPPPGPVSIEETAPQEAPTVADLLNHCQSATPARTGPGNMLEPITTPRPDQARTLTKLNTDLSAELKRRCADVEESAPNWWTEMAAHSLPEKRQTALEATLLWRAVSNQTDSDTPLGVPPDQRDHLNRYYQAAVAQIAAARRPMPEDPWDSLDEPSPIDTEHFDALIEDYSTDITPADILEAATPPAPAQASEQIDSPSLLSGWDEPDHGQVPSPGVPAVDETDPSMWDDIALDQLTGTDLGHAAENDPTWN